MKLSELIRHPQNALAREGDVPVVNATGEPLTFVIAEEPAPADPLRRRASHKIVRTYADMR